VNAHDPAETIERPNWTGLAFPPTLAATLAVMLAIAGLPLPAVETTVLRGLRRRAWRWLPGSLVRWAGGCVIAAAWLIYLHQREWMEPEEHYGSDGWWTIWLAGLYVAGCVLILWKLADWAFSRMAWLLHLRRRVT
jgi:hypothetical protein